MKYVFQNATKMLIKRLEKVVSIKNQIYTQNKKMNNDLNK